jgi:hypothetical protein
MEPLTISLALGLAKQFAPDIIRYFSSSDTTGRVADKVIDIAQTVTGTVTPQEAQNVLAVDPTKAMEFKLSVMNSEIEIMRLFLADTQSARQRDVKLAEAGIRNYRANVMAGTAILLVIVCLFIVVWTSALDEYAKGVITLILGRTLGWVEQIFSFEFGTTRSSKNKDVTISNLTK